MLALGTLLRRRPVASAWRTAPRVLAVVTLGVVGYAAKLGGRISHPEITGTSLQNARPPAGIPETDADAEHEHDH